MPATWSDPKSAEGVETRYARMGVALNKTGETIRFAAAAIGKAGVYISVSVAAALFRALADPERSCKDIPKRVVGRPSDRVQHLLPLRPSIRPDERRLGGPAEREPGRRKLLAHRLRHAR